MFTATSTAQVVILAATALVNTSTLVVNSFFTGTNLIPTTSQTLMSSVSIAIVTGLAWCLAGSLTPNTNQTGYLLTNNIVLTCVVIFLVTQHTCIIPNTNLFNQGLRNPLAALHPVCLLYWAVLLVAITTINPLTPALLTLLPSRHNNHHTKLFYANVQVGSLITALGLSMWWANQELFWGYFWNWDPIEMSLLSIFLVQITNAHQTWFNQGLNITSNAPVAVFTSVCYLYINNNSGSISSVHSFANTTLANLSSDGSLIILMPLFLLTLSQLITLSNVLLYYTRRLNAFNYALLLSIGLMCSFFYNEINPNWIFKYAWFQLPIILTVHIMVATILLRPIPVNKIVYTFYSINNHNLILLGILGTISTNIALVTDPNLISSLHYSTYQINITLQSSHTISPETLNGLYTTTNRQIGFNSTNNNTNVGYNTPTALSAVLTNNNLNYLMFITAQCNLPITTTALIWVYGFGLNNNL